MEMLAEQYPITQNCDILDCARSTYYHQTAAVDEQELRQAIATVAGEWPRYGYRRITKQLQRQGWNINHKRVERLMGELGLQAHRKPKRRITTTDSSHPFPRYANLVAQLEIVRPDQVWVSDITSIRLLEEFVYLAVLMDVFTRCIRGWYLGRSLDQSLTLRALEQPWPIIDQKSTIPIKGSSMLPLLLSHACKPLECRSVWRRWAPPGKMAMRSD
jgi:transposase InsO family protein